MPHLCQGGAVIMGRIYQRKKVWYLDVRVKGRRLRKRVGKNKRVAELALRDAEVKIERQEFGFDKQDISIDQLIIRFLEYSRTNHRSSTTKRYRAVANHFVRYLSEKRPDINFASQISIEVMEGYKSYRKDSWVNPNGKLVRSKEDISSHTRKGARARTINLEVDGIKTFLNLAVEWGFLKHNPISKMKSLKEDDRKPTRFLTIEECQRLLDATPSDLYPAFFTFLHTGVRKAELENLQWCDIDFKTRQLQIRSKPDWNPKSGERKIPISDALYRVLKGLKKKTSLESDYVFSTKYSGHSHNRLRRELIKIAKKAELEGITKLHTLRHTFASQLVMSGVDLPTVMKLMGHSDIQTTMIYAHLAPDHLADAVNKLSF